MQTSDRFQGTGGGIGTFRTKDLLGSRVKNIQGEDLGNIEDIVIDTDQGRIAYAVLSFGGFLGMGDKLFAIPWEALRLESETRGGMLPTSDRIFILNIDKEILKNAPGFDKDNWPNMADRSWGSDVYNYYGYRPYW